MGIIRLVAIVTILQVSVTLTLAVEDKPGSSLEPVSSAGPEIEATDPEAFCPMPDIDDSVDWPREPNVTQFEVGRSLSLKCHNVSETLLNSPPTVRCIDPGVWDFSDIKCKYVSCESLVPPSNSTLTLSSDTTTPGTTAIFSCNEGFMLKGSKQISCMSSGQWTANSPTCEVECPRPRVDSGRFTASCDFTGCHAYIRCDEGFVVTGENSLNCTETGQWFSKEWPRCQVITCPDPPDVENGTWTSSAPPTTDGYVWNTVVTYTCLPGLYLRGDDALVCHDTGLWSGHVPQCNDHEEEATTESYSNVTDSLTSSQMCGSPEHVPYASYTIHNRTVTYTCNPGYDLLGDSVRWCLANGTWTGESPVCISSGSNVYLWKQVLEENKEWQGSYIFRKMQIGFKMWYLASTDTSVQMLLLDNLKAKLDLKGMHAGDAVIFQTTRLLVPSDIIHDLSWRVRGELTNDTQGWKYSGTVHSSEDGYSTLYMRPVKLMEYEAPPVNQPPPEYASATALALGIAIAIMAIIVAAILAAYCVKRKGGIKGTGHRTLTSFENPVYEYENNTVGVSLK